MVVRSIFTGEIWQHSATDRLTTLIQTTELVWMSTQELIREYFNIILVVSGLSFQDSRPLTSSLQFSKMLFEGEQRIVSINS